MDVEASAGGLAGLRALDHASLHLREITCPRG